jgi:hypothetical protein
MHRRLALLVVLALSVVGFGDRSDRTDTLILWAWERPERLSFIDPRTTEVAFLAATLRLWPEGTEVQPRLQPLEVPLGTRLTAVVRIESHRHLSASDRPDDVLQALVPIGSRPGLRGLQIDFDARASERAYYRRLIDGLRSALPRAHLSITALASWCLGDPWIQDLPVDEAVPMLFQMGPESTSVTRHLARGGDFSLELCRGSVGVATDEPLQRLPRRNRRYVFSPTPWSATAVAGLLCLKEQSQ